MTKAVCPAPFVHLDIGIGSTVSVCCHTHGEVAFEMPSSQNSLVELFESSTYERIRNDFEKGHYLKSCHVCSDVEQSGATSLRQRLLKSFTQKQIEERKVKYLALRWNRTCNFKCRYCDSNYSSAWDLDSKKLGMHIPKSNRQIDNKSLTEDLLKNIEAYYFSGGEPLVIDEHLEFIQRLVREKKTEVTLVYNTNLSTLKRGHINFLELWKKFRRVEIHASLDDSDEKFNYIRSGGRWENIVQNIRMLRSEENIKLSVFVTISAFNAFGITSYLKELFKLGFLPSEIEFNYLQFPEHYDSRIYKNFMKSKVQQDIAKLVQSAKFDQGEQWKLAFLLKGLMSFLNSKDYSSLIEKFLTVTEQIDNLRNEKFQNIFPELHQSMTGGQI